MINHPSISIWSYCLATIYVERLLPKKSVFSEGSIIDLAQQYFNYVILTNQLERAGLIIMPGLTTSYHYLLED